MSDILQDGVDDDNDGDYGDVDDGENEGWQCWGGIKPDFAQFYIMFLFLFALMSENWMKSWLIFASEAEGGARTPQANLPLL